MLPLQHSPGAILREKYRIDGPLGHGGMGTVLLATHLEMGRPVALKFLRRDLGDRTDATARFAREARAVSKLQGEHAVRIFDVDRDDQGEPFLVMEYLQGTDLARYLGTHGAVPLQTAAAWMLQVCEGLAEAHGVGIVHRDLKPANLFLTTRPDGSSCVKILDFGISKALEVGDGGVTTMPSSVVGSPAYMSPEQLKDPATVDSRTDVWSLGVVFYQLLTGALPFQANSTAALAARIAADEPIPLRTQRPGLPDEVVAVVARCLEKRPEARFAGMAPLAIALAPLANDANRAAERIARVAEQVRAAQPEQEPSPTHHAPTPGASTASLAGAAPRGGLAAALESEYGSEMVRGGRRSHAPRWRVLAIGLAILPILGGALAVRRMIRSTTPLASTSSPSTSPNAPRISESAATPPAVTAGPAVIVQPQGPSATSTSAKSADAAVPQRPVPKPKNPLELDFR